MTYLLADLKPLSLTVATNGGEAWICNGASPAACGAKTWTINQRSPAPQAGALLDAPTPQFDGTFYVSKTSASPPAMAAK